MIISHRFVLARTLPRLLFCVVGLAILITGCDDSTVAPVTVENSSEEIEPDPEGPLPPDVRLRVSYEQTEVTYSNVWPGSLVGNNKIEKSRGAKLMTEYEKTREVRSYDQDGYLTASYEYIEGHPEMNMPEDAYLDLRDEMPYNVEDENPIVRFELAGETIKYIREDGTIDRSHSIDPDNFRVDPEKLDSLKKAQGDTSDADERRHSVRRSLEQQGLSLQQLDENRVAFDERLVNDKTLGRVKKVVDLRVGHPIYLEYELENGNPDMIEIRQYERREGLPVLMQRVTYDYDDRTGEWGVVARTEVRRKNVSVQLD